MRMRDGLEQQLPVHGVPTDKDIECCSGYQQIATRALNTIAKRSLAHMRYKT
jgi:hypothetical protein